MGNVRETKFIEVGVNKIDAFIDRQIEAGNKVRRENWDFLFFYPQPYAANAPMRPGENFQPAYWAETGEWGFETRVSVDADGKWRIPQNRVKPIRPIRHQSR